jgi:hypothetical protein
MLNMYNDTLKLTIEAVDFKSFAISTRAGRTILDAMGAAAPATEITKVSIHFILRE